MNDLVLAVALPGLVFVRYLANLLNIRILEKRIRKREGQHG